MLALINPHHHDYVEVPNLDTYYMRRYHPHEINRYRAETGNKWIALEAHTTAKVMNDERPKR